MFIFLPINFHLFLSACDKWKISHFALRYVVLLSIKWICRKQKCQRNFEYRKQGTFLTLLNFSLRRCLSRKFIFHNFPPLFMCAFPSQSRSVDESLINLLHVHSHVTSSLSTFFYYYWGITDEIVWGDVFNVFFVVYLRRICWSERWRLEIEDLKIEIFTLKTSLLQWHF